MKYLKSFESSRVAPTYLDEERIHSICKKYKIRNYTINSDFSIDVDGSVDLSEGRLGKLAKLPLKFGIVTENFYCYSNKLTSLEGSPTEVNGFYCADNQLSLLKGCPSKVNGDFVCSENKLTSLEYCPSEIGEDFYCDYNELESLQHCPIEIGGSFKCNGNKLTTLEYCPDHIEGDFFCSYNELTSLIDFPKKVKRNIYYLHNPFPGILLTHINNSNVKLIIEMQDEFMIWNSDGTLNEHNFNELMIEINKILDKE